MSWEGHGKGGKGLEGKGMGLIVKGETYSKVLLSANEFEVALLDAEVASKHGCRKLVAVVAVADEGRGEAWFAGWL